MPPPSHPAASRSSSSSTPGPPADRCDFAYRREYRSGHCRPSCDSQASHSCRMLCRRAWCNCRMDARGCILICDVYMARRRVVCDCVCARLGIADSVVRLVMRRCLMMLRRAVLVGFETTSCAAEEGRNSSVSQARASLRRSQIQSVPPK